MNETRDKINQLKQYALSDSEIQKVSGYKLLIYPELYKYDSLEHLLHVNNGSVLIMYMQNIGGSFGHYTVLNKISDNEVEHFDSYGLYPDKEFKFSDYNVNKKFKQNHTYLSYLLYKSPYKLSYNHHQFQTKIPATQTCGFHCVNRLKYKNLSLKEYKKMADDGVKQLKNLGVKDANYDDWVVVIMYSDIFPN